MLTVLKPNKNKLTQGYSEKHKGYDHSGNGDQNYYSSFYGKVVQAKNSETKNWVNSGALTTADYGNYIKIKGEVDGHTVYQLGAHFKPGSVLAVGTEVNKGQVVAQVGNTGNSTGAHSHTEYRDENNQNFPVEFSEESEEPVKDTKKQGYIDAYLGTRPTLPPSEDELNYRLQENKNIVEVIRSILEGDGEARKYWLNRWDVHNDDINWQQTAEQYKQTYNDLKGILGLTESADTEEVFGKVRGMLERITELEKLTLPKTIYKIEGKDFEVFNALFFKILIEKR